LDGLAPEGPAEPEGRDAAEQATGVGDRQSPAETEEDADDHRQSAARDRRQEQQRRPDDEHRPGRSPGGLDRRPDGVDAGHADGHGQEETDADHEPERHGARPRALQRGPHLPHGA
jgi:hypothetical protein